MYNSFGDYMEKYNLAIIGAGASGLAAAINASKLHPEYKIALIEHLPKVGKKILATGNGRCNLTNINALNHGYRNDGFAKICLNKYPPEKVIDFFRSLGLITYTDSEDRVYPRSNNASSVLDALRFSLDKNIKLYDSYKISHTAFDGGSFIINNEIFADRLIIAAGGKSSPSQGSDGSGYAIAKAFGHSITPLYPSLTPLLTDSNKTKPLKGVRASGVALKLICGNSEKQSFGEILFTETGVSGIAAMELASAAAREIGNHGAPVLSVDFLPEISHDELKEIISDLIDLRISNDTDSLLTGILPKAIGNSIIKKAGITPNEISKSDKDGITEKITAGIKDFKLEITGTKGFDSSQVTSGGIDINEINPETMQSKFIKGLYFSGEIIDVDGGCGGFNLQWAFASGLLAGELNDKD